MVVLRKLLHGWQFVQAVIWLRESVKNGSLVFPSNINPKIPISGMFDDYKSEMYKLIPSNFVPKTVKVEPGEDLSLKFLQSGLSYPFIVKPDIGYAGAGIFLIENKEQLEELSKKPNHVQLLVQEYIQLEREFSIMFHNIEQADGQPFFSLIEKKLPYVTGDGISTLLELIHQSPNKKLRKEIILERFKSKGNLVLDEGKTMLIDYVGAISKGAVVERIPVNSADVLYTRLYDMFMRQEINFARVDVKAESLEALRNGEFVIMEVNGIKAEPLEIYIKELPLSERVGIVSRQWKNLSLLAKRQREKGIMPNSFSECWQATKTLNEEMEKVKERGNLVIEELS